MQSYKEFLSTLTRNKYQTIVDKPITKDIIEITDLLSNPPTTYGQKSDTIKEYLNTVSMNAVIRVLEAYDSFLHGQL